MESSGQARRWVEGGLMAYVSLFGAAAVVASVWAWRTAERASSGPKGTVVTTSFLWWHFDVSAETSIFLVVIAFAIVGSAVHAANSFASYVGNRRFNSSWSPWYLLRPVIAASLAVLAYVAFRAGFLSTGSSVKDINMFGIATISGLSGLFSKQVVDKLESVMSVVFASSADAQRADKLQAISIIEISPDSSPRGTVVDVVIRGSGFGAGAKVLVGNDLRDPSAQSEGSVTVSLTAADVAIPGTLELRVRSSSGETSEPIGFTVTP